MGSPEAGSVVERLRRGVAFLAATDGPALLAVVEAAQDVNDSAVEVGVKVYEPAAILRLAHRLAALHTPDSAEEPESE